LTITIFNDTEKRRINACGDSEPASSVETELESLPKMLESSIIDD